MESTLYQSQPKDLKIIETLGFMPEPGFARLGMHLDRAEHTAALLGFPFDRGVCLQSLGEAVGNAPARVRLTIDGAGVVNVTTGSLDPNPPLWRVAVSDIRLDASDPWLAVKTTERTVYNNVRADLSDGIDEVLFLNRDGLVCEGAVTTVFAQVDGRMVTPAIGAGLLPGVLRQELLERGDVKEAVLTLDDLRNCDRLFVGNSLRGLIPAVLEE